MDNWIDVVVPALGGEVESVVLVAWRVDVGGRVNPDEPLFEVETDKAVFEVESEVGGILAEVLVPVGSSVAPGGVVGRIQAL